MSRSSSFLWSFESTFWRARSTLGTFLVQHSLIRLQRNFSRSGASQPAGERYAPNYRGHIETCGDKSIDNKKPAKPCAERVGERVETTKTPPRRESNPELPLRRGPLYPFNYRASVSPARRKTAGGMKQRLIIPIWPAKITAKRREGEMSGAAQRRRSTKYTDKYKGEPPRQGWRERGGLQLVHRLQIPAAAGLGQVGGHGAR